jgi:hypothetical protein
LALFACSQAIVASAQEFPRNFLLSSEGTATAVRGILLVSTEAGSELAEIKMKCARPTLVARFGHPLSGRSRSAGQHT